MDYTPDPHFLESQRNSMLGWHNALAELIDNSFDAGAMQVIIEFHGRSVAISDDGTGAADIGSMVRFGDHKKHSTTALGTYGVGVKEAWLWAGDTIEITTTHNGTTSTLRVKVPDDIKQINGRWEGPDPIDRPSLPGEKGTRIVISNLAKKKATKDPITRLGETFMPALESQRQIVVAGKIRELLKPYKLPELTDTVRDSFDVDGKQVEIEIGIIKDRESATQSGFLVCYGHRVIKNTTVGAGDASAAGMAGTIKLGKGWKLTKNKDDFADLADELGAAINQRIAHLCEKASRLTEDIESKELRTELTELVNSGMKAATTTTAREKRNSPENHTGTHTSTGKKGPRTKAKKYTLDPNGNIQVNGSGRKNGIQVDWTRRDPDVIGVFDAERKAILLNEANPYIASIRNPKNRQALYAVAMGILVFAECNSEGPQMLLVERADFLSSWGRVMSSTME